MIECNYVFQTAGSFKCLNNNLIERSSGLLSMPVFLYMHNFYENVCVIIEGELEDVEWFDEEELDLRNIDVPEPRMSSGLPLVDMDSIEVPWE